MNREHMNIIRQIGRESSIIATLLEQVKNVATQNGEPDFRIEQLQKGLDRANKILDDIEKIVGEYSEEYFRWIEYRKGLECDIISAKFANNVADANFMADLVVLMAKSQKLGDASYVGMDWRYMEHLIQKTIGARGFMATCGY